MIVQKLVEVRAKRLKERADWLSRWYVGSRRVQESEAREVRDPAIRLVWTKMRPPVTNLIGLYADLLKLRMEILTRLMIKEGDTHARCT